MLSRRRFINTTLAASLLAAIQAKASLLNSSKRVTKPIVISTWDFGVAANAEAWKVLSSGGHRCRGGGC